MILVIGGAFQNKKEFAASAFPEAAKGTIDGMTCEKDDILNAGMIVHFHEYIKRFMDDETYVRSLAGVLKEQNPSLVLVSNELGYGIVPIDRFDRAYREMTGRVCTDIAAVCDEVYRVVCGLGIRIK